MTTLVEEQLVTAQTDEPQMRTVERQEPFTVRVMVRPEPAADGVRLTLMSHHDATMLASRLADDLALATWEDAEWR